MTNESTTNDDQRLEQANERLKAQQARRPAPSEQPLSLVMADTEAALARRWAADGSLDDRERDARLERAARQTALQGVREQVPQHCRGTRAELVTRMHDKLFRAVDGWVWGDGNLVMIGSTGAGKTTAAAFLLRRLCAFGVEQGGEALELAKLIRWQSCRELTSLVKEYPYGEGTPDTVLRCQNARLLILDDLGAGDDKGTLERILDIRYQRGWATITTTGLRYRELVSAMGEALVRRLVECHGKSGRVLQAFVKPEEAKP